ncbi:MAG: hypothetical protein K1X64_20170 [Myxococcaceae bacterium]|nr:hypothetical protein [Myxococcaceae bacterium]
MLRLVWVVSALALGLLACGTHPRERCLAIALGTPASSLPVAPAGTASAIGTVSESNSTGESSQLNCCARANWPARCEGYGTPDAGDPCPARAESMLLGAPYSVDDCGDGRGGRFSCAVWVRDGGVAGVMSGCAQ